MATATRRASGNRSEPRGKLLHERTHADRLDDALRMVRLLANDATVDAATARDSLRQVESEVVGQINRLNAFL